MATRSGKIPFSAAFGNSQDSDFHHFSNEGGKKGDTNGREVVITADRLCTSRGADQRRGIKIQQKKIQVNLFESASVAFEPPSYHTVNTFLFHNSITNSI